MGKVQGKEWTIQGLVKMWKVGYSYCRPDGNVGPINVDLFSPSHPPSDVSRCYYNEGGQLQGGREGFGGIKSSPRYGRSMGRGGPVLVLVSFSWQLAVGSWQSWFQLKVQNRMD